MTLVYRCLSTPTPTHPLNPHQRTLSLFRAALSHSSALTHTHTHIHARACILSLLYIFPFLYIVHGFTSSVLSVWLPFPYIAHDRCATAYSLLYVALLHVLCFTAP